MVCLVGNVCKEIIDFKKRIIISYGGIIYNILPFKFYSIEGTCYINSDKNALPYIFLPYTIKFRESPILRITYKKGKKDLELLSKGKPLTWVKCKGSKIVTTLFSDEINISFLKRMANDFSCIDVQGLLRKTKATYILIKPPLKKIIEVIKQFKIIKMNEYEAKFFDISELSNSKILITKGRRGAKLITKKDEIDVKGIKIKENHPIGAGSIFLSTFFIEKLLGSSDTKAMLIANAFAATFVEKGKLDKKRINELLNKN